MSRGRNCALSLGWILLTGILVTGTNPALATQNPLRSQTVNRSFLTAQTDDALTAYTRAVSMAEVGNYDDALIALDEALDLNPEYVDAYVYRGFVRVMLGDAEQALADLNRAVMRSPTADVYKARAALRTRLGDHAGAIQDYDRALELYPEDAEAYRGRAEAYRMIGAYPAAEYNYTQVIAFDPEDGLVYRRRGELRMGTGDLSAALEDFNQAVLLRPEDPEAYYGRAILRSQLGDIAGAASDFQAASEYFLLQNQPDRYREALRASDRLQSSEQ